MKIINNYKKDKTNALQYYLLFKRILYKITTTTAISTK